MQLILHFYWISLLETISKICLSPVHSFSSLLQSPCLRPLDLLEVLQNSTRPCVSAFAYFQSILLTRAKIPPFKNINRIIPLPITVHRLTVVLQVKFKLLTTVPEHPRDLSPDYFSKINLYIRTLQPFCSNHTGLSVSLTHEVSS